MRDGRHAHQRGPLGRVGGRWNGYPDSGLQMDPNRLSRDGDVGDGLKVRNTIEEDIALPKTPVWNGPETLGKGQSFGSQVQFENIIRGIGRRGATGSGVGVAGFWGRKIVLKPLPANVPAK